MHLYLGHRIMNKRSAEYRRIYKKHFGKVPKDELGRSYDIHHKDGDHSNNLPENLVAIPIQEHYNIHHQKEDWKACVMIGLRMKLSPEEISQLNSLAANKRVQEGTHHWLSKQHSDSVKNRINDAVANGTYHMLGGQIQKEKQDKRVALGTHQWCGSKGNLSMLENGTHPSQKEFICPHCNTKGKGSTNAKRWHFDNCKKKGNN